MNRTPALALLALSTTALSRPAHAVAVDVQLTVDNAYAIYTGTSTTVTDFHGTRSPHTGHTSLSCSG